jgi:hypothetical protein
MSTKIKIESKPEPSGQPPIQSFASFLRTLGRNSITGWRWRKAGMIETINICGRQYVTGDAIARFTRRAEAGEFHREHKTPLKVKGAS